MDSNLCEYYMYVRIWAFSKSLSTDLCGVDIRFTQPRVQHMLKNTVESTKTEKIASITTQYKNIYVIIFQLTEN